MKYKFSLPLGIKRTVEWHLEHYPEDKRELESYKREMIPSPTQAYSQTAGVSGGEAHRSTEEIVLRLTSSPYVRMLEITCKAITEALQAEDDLTRKIIELVYWKREYTAEGAGLKLNLSKNSVYRRINNVLSRIALEMGYVSL